MAKLGATCVTQGGYPASAILSCSVANWSINKEHIPQLPRPQTALGALRCETVTQCAGHTRPHQLRWGDRECGYHTSCTCNTDGWPWVFTVTQLGSLW